MLALAWAPRYCGHKNVHVFACMSASSWPLRQASQSDSFKVLVESGSPEWGKGSANWRAGLLTDLANPACVSLLSFLLLVASGKLAPKLDRAYGQGNLRAINFPDYIPYHPFVYGI